jgi:hypothetical protein
VGNSSHAGFEHIPNVPKHIIDELRALRQPGQLLKRLVEVAYEGGWSTIQIDCEADEIELYFSVSNSDATGFAIDFEPGKTLLKYINEHSSMTGDKGLLMHSHQGKPCVIQLEVLESRVRDMVSGTSAIAVECNLHLPSGPKTKGKPWWKFW